MLALVLRGFFLVGIISWYSAGLMKFINDYFLHEYKSYLGEEFKRNKHLKLHEADMPMQPTMAPEIPEALRSDEEKPFIGDSEVKTCERDLCHRSQDELDYGNQPTTNDRQSQDEDDFIHHWLKRRRAEDDNAGDNLYCQAQDTICEGNDSK